jgi:hypothetical protein
MGVWMYFSNSNSFGLVPFIFGGTLLSGVKQDYKRFTIPPTEKNHWLLKHIVGMMGGYIATLTAFLVQKCTNQSEFYCVVSTNGFGNTDYYL